MAKRRPNAVRRLRRDPATTRLAIIRAAEKLFATRGVDAVSLREVSSAAGQRNSSAVIYHFKSREGLIDAILNRHADPIQLKYGAQIEILEQRNALTLRSILDVLVRPLVNKLDDPDGGPEFISISAQLTVNPALPLFTRPAAWSTPGVIRLTGALMSFVRVHEALILIHQERVASTLYSSIVAYARLASANPNSAFREVFISDLVDSIANILASTPSPETLALIERAGLEPATIYQG